MAGRIRRGLGLPKLEGEERRRAIEHPGPSWREWFYTSFLKAWLGLLFFIVDAWILTAFLSPFAPALLVPSVAAALYLELLLWRYLWYEPDPETERRGEFHPTLLRPTRLGRWTPEAERLRLGLDPAPGSGPDVREFL